MVDPLTADAVPYTPTGLKQLGITPPPSPATLHRWRLRGLRGQRIETFLRGGRRFVSRDSVREFFARITAVTDVAPYAPDADELDKSAIDRARQELEADGI